MTNPTDKPNIDKLDALRAAAVPITWVASAGELWNAWPSISKELRSLYADRAFHLALLSDHLGSSDAHSVSARIDELAKQRDQLRADNNRLRRALEWQREALDCGYYQYPDGHWSCQECSRGAAMQDEINHTDECAFGQIEAALAAPPADAVRKYEARVKAEVLESCELATALAEEVLLHPRAIEMTITAVLERLAEAARKEADLG